METETLKNKAEVNMARRSFLRYAGAGAASVGLLAVASCKKDLSPTSSHPDIGASDFAASGKIDIGSGDFGILNFAYALEQLEAAFYIQVIATPYNGISALEKGLLLEIRDHEICHRNFFMAALGNNAIPELHVDFSKIDFTNRSSCSARAATTRTSRLRENPPEDRGPGGTYQDSSRSSGSRPRAFGTPEG